MESFIQPDNVVWTKETYRVDESLFEDIQSGDEIDIYIMGGVLTVKEYVDSYQGFFKSQIREGYKDYADNDRISFVYEDDVLPKVGEKSLLFLKESTIWDGYARTGLFMGALYPESENTVAEGDETVYSGYVGNYTLSEIKAALP